MNFLCLVDICPLSDTKVVKGEVLDKDDRTLWLVVENVVVPGGSFIRAGSVVEKDEMAIKREVKLGMYAPATASKHFDLESVFVGSATFFEKDTPIAEILRSYSVHTFEQIAENAPAFRPMVDKKKGTLKAQDVLALYAPDKEQFNLWMEQVKAKVK